MTKEIKTTPGEALASHARRGWFWCGIEQISQQGVRMLVSLLLARLLAPETFGLVASVMLFLAVARNLIDGGIGARIIQKPVAGDDDYTALFWCNAVMSLLCSGVLILFAGPIASFYGNAQLRVVVIVMAVTTFLMTSGRVQQTMLVREFQFRTMALVSIVSVIFGALSGIFIALRGGGVWAILGQQLVLSLVQAVGYWAVVPWRPRRLPRWECVRDLYAFGMPVMVSQSIRSAVDQVMNVFTGKFIGMEQLGFLDRGFFIPQNICVFMQNVFFRTNYSILARSQNDPGAFQSTYVKLMRAIVSLLFVGMTVLIMMAPDVIEILLGTKWLPSVWLLRAGAILSSINLLYFINIDVLKAGGHVAQVFNQYLVLSIMEFGAIVAGVAGGLPGMIGCVVAARVLAWIILARRVSATSGITAVHYWRIFWRPLLYAAVAFLVLWMLRQIGLSLWVRFVSGVVVALVLLAACWFWDGPQKSGMEKQ